MKVGCDVMNNRFLILLAAMALTTYLIRMIPFVAFRSKIKSKFIRDFLFYIPYSVLGSMTIPYIFYSGANTVSSFAGFVVAFAMAYKRLPLLPVAAAACLVAYLVGIFV